MRPAGREAGCWAPVAAGRWAGAGLVALAVVAGGAPALASDAAGFTFDDPEIAESSGLVVLPSGNLVTTNDSGDVGRIFVVSPRGETVRVAQWSQEAYDIEALAPSKHPDRVWVGDIGDNATRRAEVVLREVGVGAANAGRVFATIRAAYPDRAHDAETLLLAPDGRLLIVTKGFLGGSLYAVPAEAIGEAGSGAGSGSGSGSERVTMEQLSSRGAMLAMATDGGFFPDGKHFLVRGYVSATLYAWPSLERLGSMPLPNQRQGEGMAIDADNRLWLTSEGAFSKVLQIALTETLSTQMRPKTDETRLVPDETRVATGEMSPTADRGWWPWIGGGVIGLGLLGYLMRAWSGPRRRTGE